MKIILFSSNFTEMCSLESNWQMMMIGSDNGLALNRQQIIIWTNDGLVELMHTHVTWPTNVQETHQSIISGLYKMWSVISTLKEQYIYVVSNVDGHLIKCSKACPG